MARMDFTKDFATVYSHIPHPWQYEQNGKKFDRAGFEVDESGIRVSDESPIKPKSKAAPKKTAGTTDPFDGIRNKNSGRKSAARAEDALAAAIAEEANPNE